MAALAETKALLARTMGLDAESVGHGTVERAIQFRMQACHLKDESSYLEKVQSSAAELQELIEALVVSETWFFRDSEAFIALGLFVIHQWLPARSASKLRLLSIPCATGEEAYSMAMTLDEIGLPAGSFQIDAVDISDRALARARKAVYNRNSFRGKNLEFRDRYFEADTHGFRVIEEIRKQVHFQQGNLLSSDIFPGSQHFQCIFCRNLLIYLDSAAQHLAITSLRRLLAPEGLLFVGPAEAAVMVNHHFVSAKIPMAFAFRAGPVGGANSATKKQSQRLPASRRPAAVPLQHHRRIPRPWPAQPAPASSEKTEIDLELAGRLANEGRLKEAAKICKGHLEAQPSSAEAHYLLGVIFDAGGDREKAQLNYRKALYLNPEHYESLMHLAYAAEKEGNAVAVQNLRNRARRIKERVQHG